MCVRDIPISHIRNIKLLSIDIQVLRRLNISSLRSLLDSEIRDHGSRCKSFGTSDITSYSVVAFRRRGLLRTRQSWETCYCSTGRAVTTDFQRKRPSVPTVLVNTVCDRVDAHEEEVEAVQAGGLGRSHPWLYIPVIDGYPRSLVGNYIPLYEPCL